MARDFKTARADRYYRPALERPSLDDRSTRLPALKSVQLPCYLVLYDADTGREPAANDARFLLLGRTSIDQITEVPLFTGRDEAGSRWPNVFGCLACTVAEVFDPAVPVTPTADPDRCLSCPYAVTCGIAGA